MADVKDGGPAFPRQLPRALVTPDRAAKMIREYAGMSLRDYFAGHALAGLLANDAGWTESRELAADPPDGITSGVDWEFAQWAYELADAMLKAREVTHG